MNTAAAQALAKSCLLANTAFTGLTVLVECDEAATPAALAAQDAVFERALLTSGIAVIILSPHAVKLDQADRGGVHLDLLVPVAICENPEVNRGTADAAAVPPRAPAGKLPSALIEAAIAALLKAGFRFAEAPFARPQFGDGFTAHYVLPAIRHQIRAQA